MTNKQAMPTGPLGFIVDNDKVLDLLGKYTSYLLSAKCIDCEYKFYTHEIHAKCCKCGSRSISYYNVKEWTCPVCKTISISVDRLSCPECKIVISECSGYCRVDPETPA